MMFKMELIGNVCKTPETKTVSSGKTVAYFDVAVNTKPETSEFVQINAWGKLGDICMAHLDKGRKVYVRGTLSYSTYSTHDGRTKVQLNVTADEVEFLTPKDKPKESATVAKGKVTADDDWQNTVMNNLPF